MSANIMSRMQSRYGSGNLQDAFYAWLAYQDNSPITNGYGTTAGAVPDALAWKANTTNGSPVITSNGAIAVFSPADVGKMMVVRAGGAAGADLVSPIASYQSPTQVTLAANAGTTQSAGLEMAWGTDNTARIQAAIDACTLVGGGTVSIPPSLYGYLCTGAIVVKPHVVLRGPGIGPVMNNLTVRTVAAGDQDRAHACLWTTQGRGTGGSGAWNTGTPFITLQRNAAVAGFEVYYPIQQKTATPDSYPPCIKFARSNGGALGHSNGVIRDMLLINPYYGVEIGDHERPTIDNLQMDALKRGIFMSETYDVPRISDVHIWNFWELTSGNWASPAPVQSYRMANLVGFEIQRADQIEMTNCFVYGSFVGYLFDKHSGLGVGYGNLVSCSSDQVAYCIVYNDASAYGYNFIGGTHLSRSAGGRGVYVGGSQTGPGALRIFGTAFQTPDNDYQVEYAGNAQADATTQTAISFFGASFTWKNAGVCVFLNASAGTNPGPTNRAQPSLDFDGCKFQTVTGYQLDSSALTIASAFTVTMKGGYFAGGARFNQNASPKWINDYASFRDGPQVGQRGDVRVLATFPSAGPATSAASLTGATEQDFSWTFTFPARSLRLGQKIRLVAEGVYTSAAAPGNWTFRVKFGATVLVATAVATVAPTASMTNMRCAIEFSGTVTAVGASGSIEAQGEVRLATGAKTSEPWQMVNTGVVTFDQTANQALTLSVQTSAGAAGQSVTLREMEIQSVN